MKILHRRSFLKGLAALSGAAICGVARARNANANIAAPETVEAPTLPWGYEALDPEYLRKLGHLGYYAFECSGGSFWALITALKETIGYPYTLIPMPTREEVIHHLKDKKSGKHLQVMMQFGVGGVANYGSLCGAPNGVSSAINIALPMADVKEIVPRLMRFYEATPFPSDKSNEYGADIGTWTGAAAIGTAAGIGAHAAGKRFGKGEADNEE